MTYRIFTLGELKVCRDDEPLRLGGAKEIALLLLLCFGRGKALRREYLVDLLWDECTPHRRHGLSQLLYQVRRRFPLLRLSADRESVQIAAGNIWLDADELIVAVDAGRHTDACSLYRGRFLEGFFVDHARRFEEWRDASARTIDGAAARAFRYVLRQADSAGDWWLVERTACRLLELDCYDEVAHAARIRSIAADGDYTRASRELDKANDLFRRDLGQPLGKELKQLTHTLKILASHSAAEAAPRAAEHRFVGRRAEFARLRELWHATLGGCSTSVLVYGESGIGKTRLCTHILRLAAIEGGRVFWGRCYETSVQIPYAGISDALLNGIRPEDVTRLEQVWGYAIAGLVPEVMDPSLIVNPQEPAGEGGRRRLFEAVARLLISAAEVQPVILYVDDLHFADASTMALLEYVIRRISHSKVVIVASLRDDEISSGTISVAKACVLFKHCIQLDPLTPADSKALLGAVAETFERTLDESVTNRILIRAEGRPLFLVELIRFMHDSTTAAAMWDERISSSLPVEIESLLVRRLRQLSVGAAGLTYALAVLGGHATVTLLQRVASQSTNDVARGLRELLSGHIVVEMGSTIYFTHQLMHDVAWSRISDIERQKLHGRAAACLQQLPVSRAGAIAIHMQAAGNDEGAHVFALQAARASQRVYAHAEAAFYFRLGAATATSQALRLSALDELCHHYYDISEYVALQRTIDELRPWYAATRNQRGLLMAGIVDLHSALSAGKVPVAELGRAVEEIASLIISSGSPTMAAAAVGLIVETAHDAGQLEFIRAFVASIKTDAREARTRPMEAQLFAVCAKVEAVYIAASQGYVTAAAALALAREAGDPAAELHSLLALGTACTLSGDYRAADAAFQDGLQLAARPGLTHLRQRLLNNYGVLMLEQGRFCEATTVFRQGLSNASVHDQLFLYGNLGLLAVEMGDWGEVENCAQYLRQANSILQVDWGESTAITLLGLAACACGSYESAADFARIVSPALEGPCYGGTGDPSYAEILLARVSHWRGSTHAAASRLVEAAAGCEATNAGGAARLKLEAARLLARAEPATAGQIARSVFCWAEDVGASHIRRTAAQTLDLCCRSGGVAKQASTL